MKNIKSIRTRNLIRGILSKNPDIFTKTINNLRRESTTEDIIEAFNFLEKSGLNHEIIFGSAFPDSLNSVLKVPLYNPQRLDIDLYWQKDRLENNLSEIIDAIGIIGSINEYLLDGDTKNADILFSRYKEKFGISLTLAFKAISARHFNTVDTGVPANHAEVIAPFLSPHRHVVAVSFEDSVDQNRQYLKIRRTFLGFIDCNRMQENDENIIKDIFSPLKDNNYGNILQSYARWGVVDALFFLFRLKGISSQNNDIELSSKIDGVIPEKILSTWEKTFQNNIFERLVSRFDNKSQFCDLDLFSHTPAWSEVSEVLNYRLSIESAIGSRMDGHFSLDAHQAKIFAKPQNDIEKIIHSDERIFQKTLHLPYPNKGFHRTISLISSIEENVLNTPNGENLAKILDKTIDVAFLLSKNELRDFLPKKNIDLLYEYLRIALFNDQNESKVNNHSLRRAFQKLIQHKFKNNIIGIFDFLDSKEGHVVSHLYGLCSETFLTELYDLFKNPDQVAEAKISILEWRAQRFSDEDALSRAKSQRLNQRLRKIRGAIDETRIYVDPIRFTEWMQEEVSSELRVLSTQVEEISKDKDQVLSLKDPLKNEIFPKLRLLNLINSCYFEFCTNVIYGVTAFVGRRIRHGTLHGYLVLEFMTSFNKTISKFRYTNPNFVAYLEDWLPRFETAVKQLATDSFHVRTKEQPKGLIIATIDEPPKQSIAALTLSRVVKLMQEGATIADIIELIQEDCWVIFEVDLKRTRDAVEELRRKFSIVYEKQEILIRTEADRKVMECVRELNTWLQRRFDSVQLWLTQPTSVSPSTTIELLFKTVVDEVSQRYPDFKPNLQIPEEEKVTLYGHRFHFFYDALYILVGNAAKHGAPNGTLSIKSEISYPIPGYLDLTVFVKSDIAVGEEYKKAEIENAMIAEIGDAVMKDNRSGLRKLRGLAEDVNEINNFYHSYSGNSVIFTIKLRYQSS